MNEHESAPDRDEPVPTTTHAEWGAGHPRLLVSSDEGRFVYDITERRTRVGSGPDAELVLPGAELVHATIEHDDRDEFVLTMHAPGEMNANPAAAGTHGGPQSETLRTGARFTAGPWTLVYQREEFADHGRPHGGRAGGELSEQPHQQPRPDYSDEAAAEAHDDPDTVGDGEAEAALQHPDVQRDADVEGELETHGPDTVAFPDSDVDGTTRPGREPRDP